MFDSGKYSIFAAEIKSPLYAEIAQLVEHNLAKVGVASSSLVFRSFLKGCSNGGIGRHEGLKIPWPLRLCGFKSRFEYEEKSQVVYINRLRFFFSCSCSTER